MQGGQVAGVTANVRLSNRQVDANLRWRSEKIYMALTQKDLLFQIDSLLEEFEKVRGDKDNQNSLLELRTRTVAAIERLSPTGSTYVRGLESVLKRLQEESRLNGSISILKALRADYVAGYLSSLTEIIHADLFGDFLEMADHLFDQGYKDPAAVITGSVLEEHLRKLCVKQGITVVQPDGRPKKADSLNAELAGANVYSKLDQKNVTAWLGLRNKAAHGEYAEYTKEQVALLIQSVRDFITRNPA